MVTVILIGIIAAFGLPNYSKSIQKAGERNAYTQLMAVQSANMIYNSQKLTYFNPATNPTSNPSDLNASTGLNINIIPNGWTFSYLYTVGVPGAFTMTATSSTGPVWSIKVTEKPISNAVSPNGNPCCVSGCVSSATTIPAC